MTRERALTLMFEALSSGDDRQFHVGIVGYFVDGIPYVADGLAQRPHAEA